MRRDLDADGPVDDGVNDRSRRLLEEGVAHQSAGRPAEAAASYERALDADSGNTAAAIGLALMLAWYGTGSDRFDRALVFAERAVATAEGPVSRAMALDARGEVRFRRGELRKAIDDSEAAARTLGSAPARTLRRVGAAHSYLGETGRAVRTLREAVAADPDDAASRIALARVATGLQDHATAIAEYTRAIELVEAQPARFVRPVTLLASLLNDRGCAYSVAGDRVRADEDFGRAVLVDPSYGYAYVNRAFQAGFRGDTALMRRYLEAGLGLVDADDVHLLNAVLADAHRDLALDVLLDRGWITRSRYERLLSAQPTAQPTTQPTARPATVGDPADEVPLGDVVAAAAGTVPRVRIVVFAANPLDSGRLGIDHEIREITAKLRASRYRDAFELVPCLAAHADDLLQELNEHTPHVVHFSGHGSRAGEIVLAAGRSGEHLVGPAALGALFRTMNDNIQIVVLNACYSAVQAKAIGAHVDYVVGMRASFRDDAAAVFAAAFYRALGYNRTVVEAFEQAKTALMLVDLPDDDVPDLFVRPGARARLHVGR